MNIEFRKPKPPAQGSSREKAAISHASIDEYDTHLYRMEGYANGLKVLTGLSMMSSLSLMVWMHWAFVLLAVSLFYFWWRKMVSFQIELKIERLMRLVIQDMLIEQTTGHRSDLLKRILP